MWQNRGGSSLLDFAQWLIFHLYLQQHQGGVGWGGVGYIFQKESVPLLGLPAGLIYPDWN